MRNGFYFPICLGAALALVISASSVSAAQTVPAEEQTASSELQTLFDEAAALTRDGAQDAAGRAIIIERWRAVQELAFAQPLANGETNPVVHLTRIKIASQLYADGENGAARTELSAGLDGIEPFRADYLPSFAEGVALLGVLMAQAGEGEAALPLVRDRYELFVDAYSRLPTDERKGGAAMAKSNLEFSLSQLAMRIGDTEAGLRYQRASLDTREMSLGADHPDTIASYYGYAGTLRRAGRMEEAETFARTAVERAVAGIDESHPSYARALEMLGIVLSRSGRPIEGSEYLLRALAMKREHEGTDNLIFGYGLHNLASIFLQRERYADAAPLFVEAEALFREKQGANSPFAIGSLAYAGQIDFIEGRYAQAIKRLSQLEERLGPDTSDLEIATRIAPDLAAALLEQGQVEAAEEQVRELRRKLLSNDTASNFDLRRAALLDALIASGRADEGIDVAKGHALAMLTDLRREGVADARNFLQSEQRAALDQVMTVAVRSKDPQLMVSAMALVSESAIAKAGLQRDQRRNAADPEAQQAFRRLQDADTAFDAADRAYLLALARNENVTAAKEALKIARAEQTAALRELALRHPERAGHRDRLDASLDDIQARLAPNEGLVAVVPVYNGAYLLAVTKTRALAERLTLDRAELLVAAKGLRASAEQGAFDRSAAIALGEAIFPASVRDLMADTDTMRVLAGGALSSLPFSLLLWNEEEETFLIDRFSIANIASLSIPDDAKQAGPPKVERYVAFANPVYGGKDAADRAVIRGLNNGISTFFRKDAPDFARLSELAPLPQTAVEAASIATLFAPGSARVFTGRDASEAMVGSDDVAAADVLLFATHGLVAGEMEGIAQPALVMTLKPDQLADADGLLTADEIQRLDLNADWVILSACDSAAGMASGLPAFSGLARAFSFAGAKNLLVTHWQVRDDIAAFVSMETLKHYRRNGSKAEALRHAIRKLRFESTLPGREDPSVWAPFVLIKG